MYFRVQTYFYAKLRSFGRFSLLLYDLDFLLGNELLD